MDTIKVIDIYKIAEDRTIYTVMFNVDYTPRPGMDIHINGFLCKIKGLADKKWSQPDSLNNADWQHTWDLILSCPLEFKMRLNEVYPFESLT